jgi:flagellar motor switch/type III secretory pathway protein FliN
MLHIENRQQLRDDSELILLVERVAACLTGGAAVQSVQRCPRFLGATPGWVIFQDARQAGFGINAEGLIVSRTNLRLKLNSLQHTRRIIDEFGGREGFPLMLTDRLRCPAEWTLYQVALRTGSVLCAVSLPAPRLVGKRPVITREEFRVSVPLIAALPWDGPMNVGETRVVQALSVECPQQRFQGKLRVSEEGGMSIQRGMAVDVEEGMEPEETTQPGALIRLDLGEIELSLQEIVALRSGSKIELKAELPLNCFMRVGATTLARGELQVDQDSIVLRIKEVMG